MPAPERPGGEFYPRRERRGDPPAYQRAARFSSEQDAGIAYERSQEAVYLGAPNDLSTYRLIVNHEWYVTILGQQPPPELQEQIEGILALGEPTDLPEEVMTALAARRAASIRQGSWVERHHRG
jgi:hypothetical protein